MNQITCNIITDLLELYADGILSEDTKKLVEDHLHECVKCGEKLAKIKQNLNIPAEINIEPIKQIKRKIKKKNIIVSIISVFIISALLLGAFSFITQYKVTIPYEKTHIYGVEQDDSDDSLILVNFIDNIDDYAIYGKQLDNATMEYYIFFNDTYYTRYFSNRIATNSYVSIPAYQETRESQDGELIESRYETVRIYYCIFSKLPNKGKIDFSERYLIWEKQPE